MFVLLFEIMILLSFNMAFKLEPSCSSFHYEEQTLEKMIRLQIFVEKIKSEVDVTQLKVLDELNALSIEREQVQKEIREMKDILATTKADIEDNLKIKVMQQSISQLADDFLKIKESTTVTVPPVAFQSHKVKDNAMADNKVIKFTTTTVNYEESYNYQTGTFTVPVGGVYIFSTQLYLRTQQAYYGIYVNEAYVQHGRIGDDHYYTAYTFVAVTDVDKGDRVTVRCIAECLGDRINEDGNSSSSFSGVLIHRK